MNTAPSASLLRRTVLVAGWCLAAGLFAHAVVFWGRGIIDREATAFVINYLAKRPFLATIFDPNLNDWGAYQAREFSYVFDWLDARVFAFLYDRGFLLFTPVSGVAGLFAVGAIYLWGARRVFTIDWLVSVLLLSLFLSCIVTQASTPILYRSSKIVLSVALLGFLFLFARLARGRVRASAAQLAALSITALAMAASDRQGFYYVAAAAGVAAMLWLLATAQRTPPPQDAAATRTNLLLVAGVSVAVIAVSTLYNYRLAPWLIERLNGYAPDFSYQQLPLDNVDWTALATESWTMFRAQVGYFCGNAPFLIVAVAVSGLCAWHDWTRKRVGAVAILLATTAGLFALLAVMILRHPPVYQIVDHAFWYYTLTLHVVFLFSVTLLADAFNVRGGWRSAVLAAVLALGVAGNVWHYGQQRATMIGSERWFRQQYAHSRRFENDFAAARGGSPTGERSSPSWLRAAAAGGTATWPIGELGYLDNVEAAYDTLVGHGPWAGAAGPYWAALRGFLTGAASPLTDPSQVADVLDGLRAAGVRHVVIERDLFKDPELGRSTADAALAAHSIASLVSDDGHRAAFELRNETPTRIDVDGLHPIAPESITASASQSADRLPQLFDHDPDSRWISGGRQVGTEWVRLAFDVPRNVALVRLVMAERSFGDYPRRLRVTSTEGEARRVLVDIPTLPLLMQGVLRAPGYPSIDIELPPNQTRTLLLEQTGDTRVWSWSIHELTLLERPGR